MEPATKATNEMFMETARQICADWVNENIPKAYEDELDLTRDDFYVVWFCKTLQNWKALVSFDGLRSHGWYFEVTYNGDKNEAYFDAYKKQDNVCVDLEKFGYR